MHIFLTLGADTEPPLSLLILPHEEDLETTFFLIKRKKDRPRDH